MQRLTSSRIFIDGARFHARHGVLPQEQLTGGDYTVWLSMDYDISKAMLTDDVDHTINYAEAYNILKSEMEKPSRLLEHLAGRIARSLFNRFVEVTTVRLKITKCNPPMGADCNGAGVEVEFNNEP